MRRTRSLWIQALVLPLLWLLSACAPLIGPYSPIAYQNATSLKAETLALVDKATEPYGDHKAEVERVLVENRKALEFVRGVPSNSLSARQWQILTQPDGALLGRFFTRWRDEQRLSRPFIDNFRAILSDAYDEIICLEANKKESTACSQKGVSP